MSKRRLEQLSRASRRREYLLRVSDVLGFAVGFKERGGALTDEPALVVYVRRGRKQKKKADFQRHQQIPERLRWHERGKTVWLPVDLVESDVGVLQSATIGSGVSVGNRTLTDTTGSIGWIARRASDQQVVLCSCYHVFLTFPATSTSPNLEFTGVPHAFITSPSREDGGDVNASVIGSVVRGKRAPTVDIAIAIPRADVSVVPAVADIGPFGKARFLVPGDLDPQHPVRVALRGRTSTTPRVGIVLQCGGVFPFQYPDLVQPLLMRDLIVTSIPTQAGDSGSLLLDDQHRPLGMLLGNGGGRSFFIHLRNITNALQLTDF
jgi:hypothetical protein